MNQRLRVALLLIGIVVSTSAHLPAQEYFDRDSLWNEIKKAKPDTNKVWLYIRLGQQYESNAPDSALTLYALSRELSEELGYTRGLISYYTNATYVYNLKGMLDTALVLNLKSVELAKAFGNPERLASCLGNVAASYTMLDQQEKAIDIYLQIIPLFEKLPSNVSRGVVYENLCVLYVAMDQPQKAKDYGLKALEIFKEFRNDYGLASILNNLSLAYNGLREYDTVVRLLKEAETVARRTNNQYGLMMTYLNLSNVNIDLGNFAAIKKYCDGALSLAKKLNDPVSELIALRGLAIYYFNMDNAALAEKHARESLQLAIDNSSLKHVGKAYDVLAGIYILKKDFRASNLYSMRSDSIRNVMFNESIAKNVQNIEAKYESEKKERRIQDLQQESLIKDLSIDRNQLLNNALIGSIVALLVIIFLAGYNYQQKRKLLTQENKVHEARIAQLETERQVLAGEAVIKGQEEERGRLAKDLHDGLGGLLSGVKFSLSNMRSNVTLDADNNLVFERTLDMLDHSITELRRVAHNMMPEVLVQFGLTKALESYCEGLRASQIIDINYQPVGRAQRLEDKKEIFIFRIVQELLNNVIKHSQASSVLVQLAMHETEVSVTVEDNGVGFEPTVSPSSVGAGLTSIRSRVDYLKGKIDIQSKRGQGTSVYVIIPV